MIRLQDSIKLNRTDGNQISGNQKPLLIHSVPHEKNVFIADDVKRGHELVQAYMVQAEADIMI